MATHSAGIVLYRPHAGGRSGGSIPDSIQVLLVHPGGPFWANKDEHGWSIPKGEFDPESESALNAAHREFAEELGRPAPDPPPDRPAIELPLFRAGNKTIHAVLIAGDFDSDDIISNVVEIEWPPRSGRRIEIPEVDRAEWCPLTDAGTKLHKGQAPIIDLIVAALSE